MPVASRENPVSCAQYNEVPRDWQDVFVIPGSSYIRVRYFEVLLC